MAVNMNNYAIAANELSDICSGKLEYILDCEVKKYTSFRIGGKCDLALFPLETEALCHCIDYLNKKNIRYTVLGNASNVLISDKGYRGVIIFTNQMKHYDFSDNILVCESGVSLSSIAQTAVRKGYTGYAFACGIPGSVGGAVYMNAGAYEGEVSDIIVYSEYYDINAKKVVHIAADEHDFSYRHSIYTDSDKVILSAGFKLEKARDPKAELELMVKHMKSRAEKQPLEYPSAGSVFKRYPGYYTAQLIDESGLKGYSIGDAQISEKHAGFIINKGNATANDVLSLIDIIKKKIFELKGIHIECEVRYID